MEIKKLYYTENCEIIFLIPRNFVIPIGLANIYDLEAKRYFVNLEMLNSFTCSKETAMGLLRNQWDTALNESKKTWLQLYKFSKMLGRDQDVENLKKDFLQGLENSGGDVNQAFDFGKNFVEQFQQAVKSGELQDKETQEETFKKIFSNLPEILSYFEEDKLEAAAKNPEAWANELYQKAFGEEEKKKIEKRKEQLRNDIRASIAEGLRKSGVKPSEDFDKTE